MILASIWLRPQAAQEAALHAVIDDLADAHGTVRFAPHLTVCGSLQEIAALDAASAYIRRSGLLPLTVTMAGVASGIDSPFRAVFIVIEDSPALRGFRARRWLTASRLEYTDRYPVITSAIFLSDGFTINSFPCTMTKS